MLWFHIVEISHLRPWEGVLCLPFPLALIHLKWQIDFYPREWMILISRLLLFCQGSSTVLCLPVHWLWWLPDCSRAERGERVSIGLVLWSVSSIWFCRQGITNFGRFGLFGTFLSSLGFRWIYQILNAKVMGAHKIPLITTLSFSFRLVVVFVQVIIAMSTLNVLRSLGHLQSKSSQDDG